MRLIMGIVRLSNGVFYARKKVPSHLAEAVAIATSAKKTRVSWLKRSLGTRDQRMANIVGKPVLAEFDRILAKAEAQLAPLPIRDCLTRQEIDRIADYYYAERLAEDDEIRLYGTGSEPVHQAVAKQLAEMGIEPVARYKAHRCSNGQQVENDVGRSLAANGIVIVEDDRNASIFCRLEAAGSKIGIRRGQDNHACFLGNRIFHQALLASGIALTILDDDFSVPPLFASVTYRPAT